MRPITARPTTDDLMSHAAFLRGLVRSLLRDGASVDHVLQETWITAIERPPAYGSNLRGWLGTVARNLALRSRRGDDRRHRRESAVARPDRTDAALDVVATLEQQQRLVLAVLALEEPHRSVIVLRYFEGRGPGEVGRRLGLSESV